MGDALRDRLSDRGSIPLISTKCVLDELLLFQRRICRQGDALLRNKKEPKSRRFLVLFIFFLNKTKRMVLILRIVYNEGFSINPEKTRVARSNARQEVTGIVVNSHMQISKEKRKQIRQQIYYIRKYGLESHLERIEENRANYLNHLLGQINLPYSSTLRTKK